ncbi:MAG TPA: enoyl-CoA hydratase/isomerase family protein [Solirubrobacteraceae bacterium]|jgi:enoyl-CoA hydratase/carnithine racemase
MGEVRIEQRERVLLATLDNPPHGLLDGPMVDRLDELVTRAEADDGIGAVVLTGGHPDRFVAHYDVRELLESARVSPTVGPRAASASLRAVGALRRVAPLEAALARTPAAGLVALERFHAVLLRMNRCGAVFVAAVNGAAMGGGCELALACDFRLIAAGGRRLGQPEILFGFPPGGGGTQRLPRMLGTARALKLILDGGPIGPDEARELGLVDEVVEDGALVERAVAYAARLARRPKAGVGAAKRAVYDGGSQSFAGGLHVERAEFAAALGSEDALAAMEAYVGAQDATGELPGYDEARLQRALDAGRFEA